MRGADAWDYLRLKQTFQESSSEAVFQDGRRLTVLIRDIGGVQQCAVEIGEQLHEAQKVNGFLRFEKIPEPVIESPPPSAPTVDQIFAERYKAALAANPGENAFLLRKRVAEQMHVEARSQKQQGQQVHSELTVPDRWKSFAEGNRRVANQVAARKS